MKESRFVNSYKNFITAILLEIILVLSNLLIRKQIITKIGLEYIGINSLFSNIILILSLSEFGLGTAITYQLYKPIAVNDNYKINVIMKYLKNVYLLIGFIILIIGILIIPYLKNISPDIEKFNNIYIIYILFLFNTISSYLFYAYKHTLIRAVQKESIINNIKIISNIILFLIQYILINVYKNYILYLSANILYNVIINIIIAKKAKLFFLEEKQINSKIDTNTKKEIIKDSFLIFLLKLYDKFNNTIGSLYISNITGIINLSIYSNYNIISTIIINFISKIFSSMNAAFANKYLKSNLNNSFKLFNYINIVSLLIINIISNLYLLLIDYIIKIWLGKNFILDKNIKIFLTLLIITTSQKIQFDFFRNSLGLYKNLKLRPVFAVILYFAIINIFKEKYGIIAILTASIINNILFFNIFDSIILYKVIFKKKVLEVVFYQIKNILIIIVMMFISINIDKMKILIIYKILFVILINYILCLFFFKELNLILKRLIKTIIAIFKRKI